MDNPVHGDQAPDGSYYYQSPSDALMGRPPVAGGLWRAYLDRTTRHDVVVVEEDDDRALAVAPTFMGWVRRNELTKVE